MTSDAHEKLGTDPSIELETLERLAALSGDERLREIRRLERERNKAQTERRLTEKKLKQAEQDLVLADQKLEAFCYMNENAKPRKYKRGRQTRGKGQATAIVCVNDWHGEELVDPQLVCGVNEFNQEIAERRIARVWEQALYLIEFARNIAAIEEVVLWAGGDLMNGMIHEEYQQANWAGPTDAALWIQDHLVSGIRILLDETKVKNFRFLASHGNHGRSTKKKRPHTQFAHSWERLIFSNVANAYKNDKRVASYVEKGQLLHASIQGHLCRFTHGDSIKFYGGIGGIMGPASKRMQAWNQQHGPAELTVIGHFHQYLSTPYFVACGCLVGFDPYAQYIGARTEAPTQTLIIVDREHGKVMDLPIFCEDRPNANLQWSTPEFEG